MRIVTIVVLLLASGCQADNTRFVPPDGQILLLIGQDVGSVADYSAAISVIPSGVTTYTDISEGNQPTLLNGLDETANWGAGDVNGQTMLDDYPASVLAIGLYLVDKTGENLKQLADGTRDAEIDRLGAFIRAANRPVYLRIGYEFDGPWNAYDPAGYIAAYRHLVDRMRNHGVDNFAAVWQSATADTPRYRDLPLQAWYPGDEYVDWMGASYFDYSEPVWDEFLSFARAREKPVMIAEATPRGLDIKALTAGDPGIEGAQVALTADEIWNTWFAPFFDVVYSNSDVIKAVAYINADWHSQPMWGPDGGSGYWGDSRVQMDAEIKRRWMKEISRPGWLHGSSTLFQTLGFDPN